VLGGGWRCVVAGAIGGLVVSVLAAVSVSEAVNERWSLAEYPVTQCDGAEARVPPGKPKSGSSAIVGAGVVTASSLYIAPTTAPRTTAMSNR
jgi:hypothetical protein